MDSLLNNVLTAIHAAPSDKGRHFKHIFDQPEEDSGLLVDVLADALLDIAFRFEPSQSEQPRFLFDDEVEMMVFSLMSLLRQCSVSKVPVRGSQALMSAFRSYKLNCSERRVEAEAALLAAAARRIYISMKPKVEDREQRDSSVSEDKSNTPTPSPPRQRVIPLYLKKKEQQAAVAAASAASVSSDASPAPLSPASLSLQHIIDLRTKGKSHFPMRKEDDVPFAEDERTKKARDAVVSLAPDLLEDFRRTFGIPFPPDFFVNYCKSLLENNQLKEAGRCIQTRNLYYAFEDDYICEDILAPLIRSNAAELVFDMARDGSEKLRLWSIQHLTSKHNYSMAIKWVERFGYDAVNDDRFAYIQDDMEHHALRGLIYAGKMELVELMCSDKPHVQKKLIPTLGKLGMREEMIKYGQKYGVKTEGVEVRDRRPPYSSAEKKGKASSSEISESVAAVDIASGDLPEVVSSSSSKEDRYNLLETMTMDMNNVLFVDTVEKLSMLKVVADRSHIVGLDCEWRPSFSVIENPVSIIQISFSEYVSPEHGYKLTQTFVVDLIGLGKEPALDEVFSSFFPRADIVKIGFAFGGDLKLLRRHYPHVKAFHRMASVVDLTELWGTLSAQWHAAAAASSSASPTRPIQHAPIVIESHNVTVVPLSPASPSSPPPSFTPRTSSKSPSRRCRFATPPPTLSVAANSSAPNQSPSSISIASPSSPPSLTKPRILAPVSFKGSLSDVVASVLSKNLSKTDRMSNWELRPLTPAQLHYAALDAAVMNHVVHSLHLCEGQISFHEAIHRCSKVLDIFGEKKHRGPKRK